MNPEDQTPTVTDRVKAVAMKPSVIMMTLASGAAYWFLDLPAEEQAALLANWPVLVKYSPIITGVLGVIARELPPGFFMSLLGIKLKDE